MAEQIKFTNEEVESIEKLKSDLQFVFTQLGQISIERKRRNEELDELEIDLIGKHSQLLQTEQELFKSLNEKYGDGNYDPITNVFTPINNNV